MSVAVAAAAAVAVATAAGLVILVLDAQCGIGGRWGPSFVAEEDGAVAD